MMKSFLTEGLLFVLFSLFGVPPPPPGKNLAMNEGQTVPNMH